MVYLVGRMPLVLLAAIAVGCGEPVQPRSPVTPGPALSVNQTVRTSATVRFVAVEGGCWALETPTCVRGQHPHAVL